MQILILGLIVFFGVHLIPTAPKVKADLVARLGAGGYRAAFSLAALAGLALIVWGFSLARGSSADLQLWTPPVWTRHLAFALMWPAFVLLVAAFTPSHIRDKAKHPMLAAIKIWALAHLLANGDLAGILLFGSFLAFGVYDRISVKKRPPPLRRGGEGALGDVVVVLAGTLAYVWMLRYGHAWLIGVPLIH